MFGYLPTLQTKTKMKRKLSFKPAVFRFKRWTRKKYGAFASLHRQVTIGVLVIGGSLTALQSRTVSAQTYDTTAVVRMIDSASVVAERVSPTRSVMTVATLFSREVSAGAPAQNFESALRLSPEIDVRDRGGKAVQSDILIRGGSVDQTSLMLNGINFTDARTGHQTHSLPVDIDFISGMELIDGVQGAGAYAGAINVRTAPLHPKYIRLHATGGQYGYLYSNISGNWEFDKGGIFAAASYKRSSGYTSNTDFSNINGYIRAHLDGGKAGYFDFQAGYQNRDFGANGFYSLKYPDQHEKTGTILTSLRWFFKSGNWEATAYFSYRNNRDRFELVKGHPESVPYNYHVTNNFGASGWLSYSWIAGQTSLGGDYTRNEILSTVLGEKLDKPVPGPDGISYTKGKNRNVGNVWLRHKLGFEKVSISLSGGLAIHQFGTDGMGSGEVGFYPIKALKLYVGAVQSMRLPTFTDLYYTTASHESNPHLVPEKAFMARLGGTFTSGKWGASVTSYWRRGLNIIDWVQYPGEYVWKSMQITKMNTIGIEISGRYHSSDGFLRDAGISYGHIYSDKNSAEYISQYALDYMRNKLSGNLKVAFVDNLTLGLTGTLFDRNGNYTDASGELCSFKPYFLLDSKLTWTLKMVELYLEVTNITCTKYCELGGLIMPSIWANAGIVVTVK